MPSALSLALERDGIRNEISIAITAITVNSSIIVKFFLIIYSSMVEMVKPVGRLYIKAN